MINKFLITLGLVVASLVATTAQAAEPTELAKFSCEFGYALDGSVYYFATAEDKGADAIITIYDNDFSVKEQFTLKGVNSYETNEHGSKIQISGISDITNNVDLLTSDIIATRGVFTNDNKWVVVVYNHTDNTSYLYSADNKKNCELPGGSGYICLSNLDGGKPYYVTAKRDGDTTTKTIWSFADVNGVITPRAVASSVKASPNPLPAGATLNIDLESEADDNTILTITDMDGRQVYRKRVHPGEVGVQVPTKFSRGVYVYTVIYGDGESYSGKVAAE